MFKNIVSLGCDCSVAASMAKYGLRNTSGPFDWCTSNFRGVLSLLETDFENFMVYDNLCVSEGGNKTVFDDIKYHITYNHDLKNSLVDEYDDIYAKYQRRISRLRDMEKEPICFVRKCGSMEELSFIFENEKNIKSIIKFNTDNEIIFVVPRYIYEQKPVDIESKMFLVEERVPLVALQGGEGMRALFDSNLELVNYLISNYDENKRKDNLIFDLQAELKKAKKNNAEEGLLKRIDALKSYVEFAYEENIRLRSRLARWMCVMNTDYSTIKYPDKLSIYGCGAIGRTFYNRIKDYVEVVEFIDREPRQDFYQEVSVVNIEKAVSDANTLVIIVPSYEYEEIAAQLERVKGKTMKTLRLEEFLANGKVLDPNF